MTSSISAQRKPKMPLTSLSPAERMAAALAPRGPTYNFTLDKTPSKKIHVAGSRFATV